jgi:hypothetical protein
MKAKRTRKVSSHPWSKWGSKWVSYAGGSLVVYLLLGLVLLFMLERQPASFIYVSF